MPILGSRSPDRVLYRLGLPSCVSWAMVVMPFARATLPTAFVKKAGSFSSSAAFRYSILGPAGDVVADGEYIPVEIDHEPGGQVWGHSEVLGLHLCWEAGELRFRDPDSGELLLTPEEQRTCRVEAAKADCAEAEARGLRRRFEELERRQ